MDGLHTLAEAAAMTGQTVDALRKKVRRGKLEAIRGNDGLVRVRLTEADVASLRRDRVPDAGQPVAVSAEERLAISELRASLRMLEEGREQAAQALDRERQRAERAETERDAARAEATAARERATAAEVRAATVEGRLAGLQEALAEARKPIWRRWLGR